MLLHCSPNTAQIMKCGCKAASATNNYDASIAQTICCTIVAIVAIVVAGFLLWKLMDLIFKGCQDKRQHMWAEKEKQQRKVVELQNKKLEILQELCYEKSEKDKKVIKKYDSEEVDDYKTAIDDILK